MSIIVNSCQKLSRSVRSCQNLSKAAKSYQKLSKAFKSCQKLSKAVTNCQKPSKAVISYPKLSFAVVSYPKLSIKFWNGQTDRQTCALVKGTFAAKRYSFNCCLESPKTSHLLMKNLLSSSSVTLWMLIALEPLVVATVWFRSNSSMAESLDRAPTPPRTILLKIALNIKYWGSVLHWSHDCPAPALGVGLLRPGLLGLGLLPLLAPKIRAPHRRHAIILRVWC